MLTLEELGEKPMEHLYSLCDFFVNAELFQNKVYWEEKSLQFYFIY